MLIVRPSTTLGVCCAGIWFAAGPLLSAPLRMDMTLREGAGLKVRSMDSANAGADSEIIAALKSHQCCSYAGHSEASLLAPSVVTIHVKAGNIMT
jgi:hypothetical protein